MLGDIKQNSGIIEFTNLDYVNLIHLQKLELGLPNAKNTLNSYTQNLNINANLENVLTKWAFYQLSIN